MAKQPNGEQFNGSAAQMRDSPWMATEDIIGAGGSIELTIDQVIKYHNVEFQGGRKKPVVYAIRFDKAKREQIVNATRKRALIDLFGPKVADWHGKRVCVYAGTQQMAGKTVPAMFIRAASEQPATNQPMTDDDKAAIIAAEQEQSHE